MENFVHSIRMYVKIPLVKKTDHRNENIRHNLGNRIKNNNTNGLITNTGRV